MEYRVIEGERKEFVERERQEPEKRAYYQKEIKPVFTINPEISLHINCEMADELIDCLQLAIDNSNGNFPSSVFAFMKNLQSEVRRLTR